MQRVGEVDNIPVSSWVYYQNRDEGFYDYAIAPPILDFFHTHVGPYPFEKLANVQAKTQYGGLENAGAISYFENSVSGNRTIENLFAHEIAHQWFGNSATEANWHHLWLSEGFATYFTNLYVEHHHGRQDFVELLVKQREQVVKYYHMKPAPVVNASVKDYMKMLNANSYQKGGWVLHMLREKVGNEKFWAAIQAYYKRYQYSNAYTKDLKDVFEEVTEIELDPFFEQWIFTPGHPQIKVSQEIKGNNLSLTIEQKQPEGLFSFPLKLLLVFEDGMKEEHLLEITTLNSTHSLRVGEKKLKELILDPDTELLFEEVK